MDHRRITTREHHANRGDGQSGRGTDPSPEAAVNARANRSSESSGCADRGRVTAIRSISPAIDHPGLYLNLSPVGQLEFRYFNLQMRNSGHVAGLLRFRHDAAHRLPLARDQQSVSDNRFQQRSTERVAGLIVVA